MSPKPHKLVRPYVVGNKHVILNRNVSRQRDFIRKDIVVADRAVVRHVTADHYEIARADACRLAFTARPVQRTKLANDVVVPDFEETLLAAIFHVLRLTAHDRMFENPVSGPQPGKPLDHGIGPDLAIWPDFHVIFDYSCRMDRHLPDFEDNRVLWILQILFMMRALFWVFTE